MGIVIAVIITVIAGAITIRAAGLLGERIFKFSYIYKKLLKGFTYLRIRNAR